MEKLDLHGVRHHEVDLMVENFIYQNQHEIPLTIICGNSSKMVELVTTVRENWIRLCRREGVRFWKNNCIKTLI